MRFLPVGLDLEDRPCVVVGGGAVGTRKVRSLLRVGARVTVVSPRVTDPIAAEVRAGRVRWSRESFRPAHIEGARLVVVATDDPETNALAAQLARRRGSLVCDATSGARSDVIFGALLEDDGLTVATFTDGLDPARARRSRDRIAGWLAAAPGNGAPDTPTHEGGHGPTVLVLVAHGSRDPSWGRPLEALAADVARDTAPGRVRLAYSQFAAPSIGEAVRDAVADGARRVRLLPLFMTAGGHVERDIRPAVDALRDDYPDLDLELLPPVGALPSFRTLLAQLAGEVAR